MSDEITEEDVPGYTTDQLARVIVYLHSKVPSWKGLTEDVEDCVEWAKETTGWSSGTISAKP